METINHCTEDVLFAVTTRTQFTRQTEEEAILDKIGKLTGVVPMASLWYQI